MIRKMMLLCAATLALSACETVYNPLEVCTPKWIGERADAAMAKFGSEVARPLGTIRTVSSSYQQTGQFDALQLVNLLSALNTVVNKFEDSRALEDMRVLQRTCNDPTVVKIAMTKFLYDQGAPDALIDLLNDIDKYQRLIEG